MNLRLRAWGESDRAALRSLYAASRDMAFPWSAPHPAEDFDAHTEGEWLLAACVRHCTDRPTLKCLLANARALQFYQALGWTVREQAHGPDGPYLLLAAP